MTANVKGGVGEKGGDGDWWGFGRDAEMEADDVMMERNDARLVDLKKKKERCRLQLIMDLESGE